MPRRRRGRALRVGVGPTLLETCLAECPPWLLAWFAFGQMPAHRTPEHRAFTALYFLHAYQSPKLPADSMAQLEAKHKKAIIAARKRGRVAENA